MKKGNKKNVGAMLHRKGVASFRVWAPFAKSVAVTGSFNNWGQASLASEGDGYWYGEVENAESGQEYKYVINTGEKELFKNDPRSLQVTTSEGSSVLVLEEFDWEGDSFTPPPYNEQVIYELHVGTFFRPDPAETGTLQDVTAKLDYLADLGVNMIELMPISTMADDRGWGYAPEYIYAVESLYGGRRKFMEFVKAAHQRGIGVILDVVYNHLGPDEEMDIWQFDGWNQDNKGGIYFYNDWRAETPWGETRPDYGRQEVRQYILDNVKMWLCDCHLDGLRLDSTIYLRNVKGHNDDPEHDIPEAWSLMQEITAESRKINPSSIVIAEDVGGNHYITKQAGEGGAGFSAQWEVGFPFILRQALSAVNDNDRNLTGISGMLVSKYNGDSFQRIVYSDSHDSAANGGARLSEEIAHGNVNSIYARKRSLIASAIVLTAPGIPMIFQGQEFMEDGSFTDWDALDWDRLERFGGIHLAHKHLIALRKNAYGNTHGLLGQSVSVMHLNEESKIMAYHRWDTGGARDDVVIVINFANCAQKGYYINFPRKGAWTVRFDSGWSGYSSDFRSPGLTQVQVDNDVGQIDIGPYSVLILSQE